MVLFTLAPMPFTLEVNSAHLEWVIVPPEKLLFQLETMPVQLEVVPMHLDMESVQVEVVSMHLHMESVQLEMVSAPPEWSPCSWKHLRGVKNLTGPTRGCVQASLNSAR